MSAVSNIIGSDSYTLCVREPWVAFMFVYSIWCTNRHWKMRVDMGVCECVATEENCDANKKSIDETKSMSMPQNEQFIMYCVHFE